MTEVPETEQMLLRQLRATDRDRYLSTLLAPADKRQPLAALYAFNAEIARVRQLVSEPLPGEVRLQYWRDILEGEEHGATEANPVAAALLEAAEAYSLPRQTLINMTEARIFDLYDDPMGRVSDFEGYAGETASALIQLASLILGPDLAASHAEHAGHAGVAQSVAGAILLLPEHHAKGQVFIPSEILSATGLTRESFLKGDDKERIGNAIRAFVSFGRQHFDSFRRQGAIAAPLIPAYLPMVSCKRVFSDAERCGAGCLEKALQPSQWRRQLMMMRSLLFRKF